MDKSIILERHTIEAWGLWWTQWQKQTKDKLKKHVTSPRAFVNEHMPNDASQELVSSKTEGFPRGATGSLILSPK